MGVLSVEMLYSMVINEGMEGIPVRKLICEMCGEEIDTSFMDKYDMHPAATCRVFGKNMTTLDRPNEDLEYDLCENCTNELVTFLKG